MGQMLTSSSTANTVLLLLIVTGDARTKYGASSIVVTALSSLVFPTRTKFDHHGKLPSFKKARACFDLAKISNSIPFILRWRRSEEMGGLYDGITTMTTTSLGDNMVENSSGGGEEDSRNSSHENMASSFSVSYGSHGCHASPSPPPPLIRIAFCVYFMNAGSTTRAIEIARAVRDDVVQRGGSLLDCSDDQNEAVDKASSSITAGWKGKDVDKKNSSSSTEYNVDFVVDLRFFSYACSEGSHSYESLAKDAGFRVETFGEDIKIDDAIWSALLDLERTAAGKKHFFPPPYEDLTIPYVRAIRDTLRDFKPTIVVHGLFPEVSIASGILGVPKISFGPVPMDRTWMMRNLCDEDVPFIADANDRDSDMQNMPDLAPPPPPPPPGPRPLSSLQKAALECGWEPQEEEEVGVLSGSFDRLLRADLCLICDLESNYRDKKHIGGDGLTPQTRIVGPIFRNSSLLDVHANDEEVNVLPKDIMSVIDPKISDGRPKVFLTMASSGEKSMLLEGARGLSNGRFRAVIASPANVCGLDEIAQLNNASSCNTTHPDDVIVFACAEFLPISKIASMVDVVVTHGGQGTLQSVLASGTPVVGVAMQREQVFNLKNIVRMGAGIAIPRKHWKAENIRKAIERVLKEYSSYKEAACRARDEIFENDGRQNAASEIVSFALHAAHVE